eukprot:9502856-Pyramimonas_sp.AAC.1
MCAIGPLLGLPVLTAFRAGMFLAPGGEFAFVTFGLAVVEGIITKKLAAQLTLVGSNNNMTSFYGSSCANNKIRGLLCFTGINWKIVSTYEPKITMLTSSPGKRVSEEYSDGKGALNTLETLPLVGSNSCAVGHRVTQ